LCAVISVFDAQRAVGLILKICAIRVRIGSHVEWYSVSRHHATD